MSTPEYSDDSPESDNLNSKNEDENTPCPAFEVCSELGTAMDLCTAINRLTPSEFAIRQNIDLHGIEPHGDVSPQTFEDVAEDYQETLEDYNEMTATPEVIEIRRVHDKLEHLQCCLSSIVLLLSRKST